MSSEMNMTYILCRNLLKKLCWTGKQFCHRCLSEAVLAFIIGGGGQTSSDRSDGGVSVRKTSEFERCFRSV